MLFYVSLILLGFFGLLFITQYLTILASFLNKKDSGSFIPILPGVIGVIGFLLYPGWEVRKYWWLPLVFDFSCLPLILTSIYLRMAHVKKKGND